MNIKRLIAAGAAGAMILGTTAVPALAWHWWDGDDPFTLIKNKDTEVNNLVVTTADTGNNGIGNGEGNGDALINTGNATALSSVLNKVNWNQVDPCECEGTTVIKNIDTEVNNLVATLANTGWNYIGHVDGAVIDTGNATAGSVVENAVNTNLVGI